MLHNGHTHFENLADLRYIIRFKIIRRNILKTCLSTLEFSALKFKCNFLKKLRTKFFWVSFHLSRHETTVFSVTDATKRSGNHICDFAHFSN